MATTTSSVSVDPVVNGPSDYNHFNSIKAKALDNWLNIIVGAGAAGVGGRSLLELARSASGMKDNLPEESTENLVVVPRKKQVAINKMAEVAAEQALSGAVNGPEGFKPSTIGEKAFKYAPWLYKLIHTQPGKGTYMSGDFSSSPMTVPTLNTLGAPAALAAMAAGWSGVGALAGGYKEKNKKQELDELKQRYEAVARDIMSKRAYDLSLVADALDELAEHCTSCDKQADGGVVDTAITLPMSLYGPYAALTGLSTGKLMYDYFNSRSDKKILEAAQRRRAAERLRGRMGNIEVVTEPEARKKKQIAESAEAAL